MPVSVRDRMPAWLRAKDDDQRLKQYGLDIARLWARLRDFGPNSGGVTQGRLPLSVGSGGDGGGGTGGDGTTESCQVTRQYEDAAGCLVQVERYVVETLPYEVTELTPDYASGGAYPKCPADEDPEGLAEFDVTDGDPDGQGRYRWRLDPTATPPTLTLEHVGGAFVPHEAYYQSDYALWWPRGRQTFELRTDSANMSGMIPPPVTTLPGVAGVVTVYASGNGGTP